LRSGARGEDDNSSGEASAANGVKVDAADHVQVEIDEIGRKLHYVGEAGEAEVGIMDCQAGPRIR